MSIIRVVSSGELDNASRKKIETVFSKKHSDKVEFAYETDVSLIGGILVIDGEKYYDATVRGQLSDIKRSLR